MSEWEQPVSIRWPSPALADLFKSGAPTRGLFYMLDGHLPWQSGPEGYVARLHTQPIPKKLHREPETPERSASVEYWMAQFLS